ncbi:MAG TPA: hypothetical protein VN493_19875 [Thermoanaerobaculia bacterium]|nr:hypothetical protein [Thermoanaerobaculia bacterium]
MRLPLARSLALALLVTLTAPLAAQSPIGRELSVNQTLAGRQMTPDVGVATDGSFVVVWADETAGRVWVRRYGANGKPRGGEFRVSRLGDRQQSTPAVAVRPDGSFVVVWNRVRGGGKPVEVYASRFTVDGRAVGQPRLVGFAAQRSADEPAAVAILPDGGFFVAWALEDGFTYWEDGDFPSRDLHGRRFTRDGVLVGGRVTLNSDPSLADERHPKCAVSQGRELVCTWTAQMGEGYFGEILFRRFDLNGLPLADELQVNEEETTGWPQRYPSLAVREDGAVLVAWLDSGASEQILGRVLDASGGFLGPSFSLATTEAGFGEPEAAATAEGFAVVWTTRTELLLRRVSAAGAVTSGARRVNLRRDANPGHPAIAFGPGGGAVAWAAFTQGFHDGDIVARRLR